MRITVSIYLLICALAAYPLGNLFLRLDGAPDPALAETGILTRATIVGAEQQRFNNFRRGDEWCDLTYQFEAGKGQIITVERQVLPSYCHARRIGQQIDILYDPANPQNSDIPENYRATITSYAIYFMAFCFCLLGFGVLLWLGFFILSRVRRT